MSLQNDCSRGSFDVCFGCWLVYCLAARSRAGHSIRKCFPNVCKIKSHPQGSISEPNEPVVNLMSHCFSLVNLIESGEHDKGTVALFCWWVTFAASWCHQRTLVVFFGIMIAVQNSIGRCGLFIEYNLNSLTADHRYDHFPVRSLKTFREVRNYTLPGSHLMKCDDFRHRQ